MWSFLVTWLLSVSLSCSPVIMYAWNPDVLSWEDDIQKFEHLDSTDTYPDDAIMFAGSSSIRLWSTLAKDMAPYPVIQRGYGGAKLSDLSVYASRIIYPHPCRAIVMFVANDITGKEDDKSPEEVARLFTCILKTIRYKFPDTPVLWIEVTPTASRWNVWPQIAEANKLVKEICDKEKDTYFIETKEAFLNSSGTPNGELFMDDKLHLNARGYEIWTQIIREEVRKVLQPTDISLLYRN